MSKRIHLKDGSLIEVRGHDKLVFEDGWVHIKVEYMKDRYRTEKSIPSSNIKIIEEEN